FPAASGADEDVVDAELGRLAALRLDAHDLLPVLDANRLRAPAGADLDALLAQDLAHGGDDVGVLLVEDVVGHLDYDDVAADAAEELGELDADGAAAED